MTDDIKPIFSHHTQCVLVLTGMALASVGFLAWHAVIQ